MFNPTALTRDASLIHWLYLFPHPSAHRHTATLFTFSLGKSVIFIYFMESQSLRRKKVTIFLSPSKFHGNVLIIIKGNILPVLICTLFLFIPSEHLVSPSSLPASCDMHYTDQCNGISGSLTAHLPFSFYPVSMPLGEFPQQVFPAALVRLMFPMSWSHSQLCILIETGTLPVSLSEIVFTPASLCFVLVIIGCSIALYILLYVIMPHLANAGWRKWPLNSQVTLQAAMEEGCYRGKLNFTSSSVTLMTMREGVDPV